MSKKQILVGTGTLITILLLWFLWSIWLSGYYVTILTTILFPYASLEMFVGKKLELPDTLGAPTIFGIFLACIQYPIYGWLIGKALIVQKLKPQILRMAICHFGISAIILFIYLTGRM
jgi:hypothetical protein